MENIKTTVKKTSALIATNLWKEMNAPIAGMIWDQISIKILFFLFFISFRLFLLLDLYELCH